MSEPNLNAQLLVVEDDPSIAAVLQEILTGKDYRVRLASNPDQATAAVGDAVPDLILMDINLSSDIDGIETMRRLRETHEDLPVCFVTAFSDEETVKRAEALGPMAYLVKPFEMADVLTMVNISLANTRRLRERIRKLTEAAARPAPPAASAPSPAPSAAAAAASRAAADVLEDKLTGLANRRAMEALIGELEPDPHFFAALLAVDHIPLLRQRFGGAAVDQILFSYSQHLGQHMPEYCLLGRWDQTTFIAVPKEAGSEGVREVSRVVSAPMLYHLRLPGRSALLRVSSTLRVAKGGEETPVVAQIEALMAGNHGQGGYSR